jgi:hypothetical protein
MGKTLCILTKTAINRQTKKIDRNIAALRSILPIFAPN